MRWVCSWFCWRRCMDHVYRSLRRERRPPRPLHVATQPFQITQVSQVRQGLSLGLLPAAAYNDAHRTEGGFWIELAFQSSLPINTVHSTATHHSQQLHCQLRPLLTVNRCGVVCVCCRLTSLLPRLRLSSLVRWQRYGRVGCWRDSSFCGTRRVEKQSADQPGQQWKDEVVFLFPLFVQTARPAYGPIRLQSLHRRRKSKHRFRRKIFFNLLLSIRGWKKECESRKLYDLRQWFSTFSLKEAKSSPRILLENWQQKEM